MGRRSGDVVNEGAGASDPEEDDSAGTDALVDRAAFCQVSANPPENRSSGSLTASGDR